MDGPLPATCCTNICTGNSSSSSSSSSSSVYLAQLKGVWQDPGSSLGSCFRGQETVKRGGMATPMPGKPRERESAAGNPNRRNGRLGAPGQLDAVAAP